MIKNIIGLLVFVLGFVLLFVSYDKDSESLKFKVKPIFVLVILLGVAIMSLVRIPANHVGIKYSAFGGVQEKTLSEGFKLKMPFLDSITLIDTTIQERTIEDITIQSKDGERITFEVNVKYNINKDNAATVFKRYGSMDNLKTNIVRNDTEAAMAKVVSQNETFYILTEGRPEIENLVVDDLTERFALEGVELRSFTIKQSSGSDEYTVRMNAVKDAENLVKEAEIKKQASQIDAERKVIEAQAEADANEIKQRQLTPEILMLEYITNWKGDRPLVVGDDNIIDVSELLK